MRRNKLLGGKFGRYHGDRFDTHDSRYGEEADGELKHGDDVGVSPVTGIFFFSAFTFFTFFNMSIFTRLLLAHVSHLKKLVLGEETTVLDASDQI